jgi:hypothetical protein
MFSQMDRYRAAEKARLLLRRQFACTLGGLFCAWRDYGGEPRLFFNVVIKALHEGKLRVAGRRRPQLYRDEPWELVVDPTSCCVRFAADGTSYLIPTRLIVEDTEDEIQLILDSYQYLYRDLRFSKTEAERLWPPKSDQYLYRDPQFLTPQPSAKMTYRGEKAEEPKLAEAFLQWSRRGEVPRQLPIKEVLGICKTVDDEPEARGLVQAIDPRWMQKHGPGKQPGTRALFKKAKGDRERGRPNINS